MQVALRAGLAGPSQSHVHPVVPQPSWLSFSRTLRSTFPSSCGWQVLSPWSLHTGQRVDLWRALKGLQIGYVLAPRTETSAPRTLAGESGVAGQQRAPFWGLRSPGDLFWALLSLPVTGCDQYINTRPSGLPVSVCVNTCLSLYNCPSNAHI